ncbi:hypothetical protein CBM2615_B70069 [Cupriavidus taiwanensis]|nr:hypothetical protein CBM2614_B60070 [Cupriavidus taiwanensis]SOZ70190.1 hypothetical protein CBM2615_B70069 [Cupriavidus taiwanensis]
MGDLGPVPGGGAAPVRCARAARWRRAVELSPLLPGRHAVRAHACRGARGGLRRAARRGRLGQAQPGRGRALARAADRPGCRHGGGRERAPQLRRPHGRRGRAGRAAAHCRCLCRAGHPAAQGDGVGIAGLAQGISRGVPTQVGLCLACPAGRSERPVVPKPYPIVLLQPSPHACPARRLALPTSTLPAIAGASGKPAAMANPRIEPATDS